jgi:hypothetical protein
VKRRLLAVGAVIWTLGLAVALASDAQTKPAASSSLVVTYYFMPG